MYQDYKIITYYKIAKEYVRKCLLPNLNELLLRTILCRQIVHEAKNGRSHMERIILLKNLKCCWIQI